MVAGHLQQKNGTWYLVITYRENDKPKAKWYSTGLPIKGNKKKAEELLHEKRVEFTEALQGTDCTKGITDKINKYRNITLRELYPEWIEHKAIISSAETNVPRIKSSWKKYYLNQGIIDIPIGTFTRSDLQEWSYKIIKMHKMTSKEYGNFSLIIRQMLQYAVDKEIIDRNVYRDIQQPKGMFRKTKKKPSATQVYTMQEQERLEAAALLDFEINTRRIKYPLAPIGIIFMLQTGIRVGELCALKFEDITENGEIHVQRMYQRDLKEIVEHTKSDEGDRLIPLNEKAQNAIRIARELQNEKGASEYIFSISETPLSPHSVNDTLKTLCNRLGILYRSSHKLRKTFISKLIDANINIDTVREIAGHSDEKTTLNYYCYDRNSDKERREKILSALE